MLRLHRAEQTQIKPPRADADRTVFFLLAGWFSVGINQFSCCPFVRNNSEFPCYQGHGWNSLYLPIWKTAETKASMTGTADATGLGDPEICCDKLKPLLSPGQKQKGKMRAKGNLTSLPVNVNTLLFSHCFGQKHFPF